MAAALPLPQPETPPNPSPKAIRATLLAEDLDLFDRQYGEAMRKAITTLDLNPVLEMLEQWRQWGVSSSNPEAHRRLLERMARVEAGERLETVPWVEVKRERGLG